MFQGPDDPKKYLRGIGDEWEAELSGQGASPLVRRQLTRGVCGNLYYHEMVLSREP